MSTQLNSRFSDLLLLFANPVFLASISSWFFAQLMKAVIYLFISPRRSIREVLITFFWKTGGMPSSHSALVTALTVSIGFNEGFNSNIFIVALCLALIVIRDSLGVRRSSGLQARLLNQLNRDMATRFGISHPSVKEIHGHAPLEVMVGAIFGVFIAVAFALL